ncbi:MAG: hypothetical protein GX838_03225 [Clostridiaceae bacterium]|nr:hypothetical protein [Clostridiaceae bacterium]
MEDQKEEEILNPDEKKEVEEPCAACDEQVTGCSGCGSRRKRVDTWWYVIALLAILLVAILIRRFGSGST